MTLFLETWLPVRCDRCRHYQVTPEAPLPYRCRAMIFKGRRPPAEVVFRTANGPCLLFASKKANAG
ncbi:MAG: hypothetical protein SWC96_04760 [Thermodesulfobacteriota bacterium]|nr:hypothetical protein [Thermodesulfobacteriota bacterium]